MLVVSLPPTRNGATTLIWFAPAYNSGAGTPSKSTSVPPRFVATLPVLSISAPSPAEGPRPAPYRLMISPGATTPVIVYLADSWATALPVAIKLTPEKPRARN